MSQNIITEVLEPGVASIVLNRPNCCNALSVDLLEDLCKAILELEQDFHVRVVILRGEGTIFSSGIDLKEVVNCPLSVRSFAAVERALWMLRDSPLITIAVVDGGAFASGVALMAACDIAIASEGAKFGFPEVRRGVIPVLICGVLPLTIREGEMRQILLAGEPISALRAQQIGLVQLVVPAERLREEAISLSHSILAGGPDTVRSTKAMINRAYRAYRPEDAGARELVAADAYLAAGRSREAREGVTAFLEKRSPSWITEPCPTHGWSQATEMWRG